MRKVVLKQRAGYYIKVISEYHESTFEFCPLEEISEAEFLQECSKITIVLSKIVFAETKNEFLQQLATLPASKVLFTFQVALIDLFSQRTGILFFDPYHEKLQINALITSGSILDQVEEAVSFGFTMVKIKVADGDAKEEILEIQNVCEQWPDIRLRLDANKKWEKLEAVEAVAYRFLTDWRREQLNPDIDAAVADLLQLHSPERNHTS